LLKIIITLVGACLFAFCFGLFETVAIFNAVSISNSPETALIIALVMVALYVTFLTLRKDITMDISFIIVGFLFIAAIFWALITGRFTLSLFTALSIGIYVYYQAVWFFQFDIAHSQKIAVSLMAGVTVFVIALSRVLGRVIAEIFFTRVGPDEVIQTISPWALSIFVLALFFLLILMVKIIKTSIKDNKMALESFSETEISIRECLKTFVKKYHLTDRETQVLQEYALGRSMPYISKKMYLSENTIKTYISRAYAKLGVHNKQELKSMIEQELKEMPGS
jgi:DNA-binding CsgD family transcriptional regulator